MSNVQDVDRGMKKIIAELLKSQNIQAVSGIFEESTNNGKPVAHYAAANEFGAKLKNGEIPARPFVRPSVDENKAAISADLEAALGSILNGKSARSALKSVADAQARRIQKKIKSNVPPPNARSTIKAKGHSRTLIDTGAMLRSVKGKVRAKNAV